LVAYFFPIIKKLNMPYNVIIVEGDAASGARLRAVAEEHGFVTRSLRKGAEALEVIRQEGADLVVLAGELPDMDRNSWLRVFRQADWGRDVAVVVSSESSTEAEVVSAFEGGADDFILNTCDPSELGARLRAVLRRRYERAEVYGEPMSGGPIVLDPARHECSVRGRLKRLRRREFELLEILMRKAGRVLSRSYLLESVWGMSRQADTRAVDVAISRLRQVLGSRAGRWIETLPGFGYRFSSGQPGAR
jgi:DNA-binding response OmpR family regulator